MYGGIPPNCTLNAVTIAFCFSTSASNFIAPGSPNSSPYLGCNCLGVAGSRQTYKMVQIVGGQGSKCRLIKAATYVPCSEKKQAEANSQNSLTNELSGWRTSGSLLAILALCDGRSCGCRWMMLFWVTCMLSHVSPSFALRGRHERGSRCVSAQTPLV